MKKYELGSAGWVHIAGTDHAAMGVCLAACRTEGPDLTRELVAQANWAAEHEQFVRAAAKAIRAHRDGYVGRLSSFIDTTTPIGREHGALLAALDLLPGEPKAEAEPLTITVPPDTVGEVVALLTKVAELLEKGDK